MERIKGRLCRGSLQQSWQISLSLSLPVWEVERWAVSIFLWSFPAFDDFKILCGSYVIIFYDIFYKSQFCLHIMNDSIIFALFYNANVPLFNQTAFVSYMRFSFSTTTERLRECKWRADISSFCCLLFLGCTLLGFCSPRPPCEVNHNNGASCTLMTLAPHADYFLSENCAVQPCLCVN